MTMASALSSPLWRMVAADASARPVSVTHPEMLSASEMARAIRQGQFSSLDVVRACIDRIKVVNDKLNAVVQLREENALKEAVIADRALAKGITKGVLHGVPFTIKDSFDTSNMISTAGTVGRKNYIPDRDATVVRRLRDAGGILLGKTNTPELTLSGETDNLVYGRTNNPLDVNRTPGGSSGGAAAIISAMGSPLDIGSDTGGSIRWPAHCCGIQGFKPSSGRVPRTGHIISFLGDLQFLTQPGPLARTVEDLVMATQIIAGKDNIDPHVICGPFEWEERTEIKNLRVLYYRDNLIASPSSDIEDALLDVVDVLRKNGAVITEKLPEKVTGAYQLMLDLVLSDISWVEQLLVDVGTTDSSLPNALASLAPDIDVPAKSRLIEEWDRYRSWMLQIMQDYDLIVCPVAPVLAPLHGDFKMQMGSYLSVYNLTGWPAASIRVGTSSDNLPINIQLIGRYWADELVLKVARFLEREL